MDQETYEQFSFQEEDLDWELKFLKDEMEGIVALYYNEEVIGLELPNHVTLRSPKRRRGSRAPRRRRARSPPRSRRAHVVQIPEYIDQGETLKIDTRTGESLGRA